uniref:Eukaryotic translation initiation factor-related n=1 Tax=Davidia involucrata TaxID=16924 RepID=A0A5B7BPH5_DAVIN
MSKKKVSGGSTTMTLKDFHGGSIPSDLPLPSAPGVTVRSSDRAGFDRQTSWGNPMGRSDHRLRPGSAGSARNFDDKTPFLTHTAHIGRNFDEDERKPLDGVSGPRRTVSDESIPAPPVRAELKPDYSSSGRLPSRQVLSPIPQLSGGNASSYASRFTEATHVGGLNSPTHGGNSSYSTRFTEASYGGVNSQNMGGNSGPPVAGTYPNAWAARKEAVGVVEPVLATGSGPNAASKLAHASALEKVSSGRWQSKQPIHHQTDVEVIRHPETESEFYSKGNDIFNMNTYKVMDVAGGREYHDMALARHAERSLAVDDGIRGGGRELLIHERARSPFNPETRERKSPIYADGVQPALNDVLSGGLDLQSPMPSESSERPKLKLLPRSMPLESLETPLDCKQGYQQPSDSSGHVENASESYGNANPMKHVLAESESENRAVDRPKLNLKPRAQPLEQLEGNIERERKTLFGGARPRELVLKERGIDDVAVNNHDMGQPSIRIKQYVSRTETMPMQTTPTRYNEKAENIPLDNRIRKNTDRRDHRVDAEGTDVQRRNWRSGKETEKQQQPPQERPPSPETWRKPVEQPKTAFPDAPGLRYGKAASALELAQAFSRSVSDPKTADRFSGQRGIPERGQIPFSRLMGPNPRPQINGY